MKRKNLREMAAEYGVSPRTFSRWVAKWQIPYIRPGREPMFDPDQVEHRLMEAAGPPNTELPDIKAKKVKKRPSTQISRDRDIYAQMVGLMPN